MLQGKQIIIALIAMVANFDTNKTLKNAQTYFESHPEELKTLDIDRLLTCLWDLSDSDIAKALSFLIVNYYKMQPDDDFIFASFNDGDIDKIKELIEKDPIFFNDLIASFIDYLRAGSYPLDLSEKQKDNILLFEIAFNEANVVFIDKVISSVLLSLLNGITASSDFITASSALSLAIFYDLNISTNADIYNEVYFLRGYRQYLYKMMHALVYAMSITGHITLDEPFKSEFTKKVSEEDYEIETIPRYTTYLMRYYFLASKIKSEVVVDDKTANLAKKIDPLYKSARPPRV